MTPKISRASLGFRPYDCGQCRMGVSPGDPITFDPKCYSCAQKKLKGKRTGNEPAPLLRPKAKWVDHVKLRAQRVARAKSLAARTLPRGVA